MPDLITGPQHERIPVQRNTVTWTAIDMQAQCAYERVAVNLGRRLGQATDPYWLAIAEGLFLYAHLQGGGTVEPGSLHDFNRRRDAAMLARTSPANDLLTAVDSLVGIACVARQNPPAHHDPPALLPEEHPAQCSTERRADGRRCVLYAGHPRGHRFNPSVDHPAPAPVNSEPGRCMATWTVGSGLTSTYRCHGPEGHHLNLSDTHHLNLSDTHRFWSRYDTRCGGGTRPYHCVLPFGHVGECHSFSIAVVDDRASHVPPALLPDEPLRPDLCQFSYVCDDGSAYQCWGLPGHEHGHRYWHQVGGRCTFGDLPSEEGRCNLPHNHPGEHHRVSRTAYRYDDPRAQPTQPQVPEPVRCPETAERRVEGTRRTVTYRCHGEAGHPEHHRFWEFGMRCQYVHPQASVNEPPSQCTLQNNHPGMHHSLPGPCAIPLGDDEAPF